VRYAITLVSALLGATLVITASTTTTATNAYAPPPAAIVARDSIPTNAVASKKKKWSCEDVLARRLHREGFRGKNLREAWAIAMRESGGNPGTRYVAIRDDSFGIFQINMIGSLESVRNAKFRKYVPGYKSKNDLFDPAVNIRVASFMSQGGDDWSNWVSPTFGKAQYFYGKYPCRVLP